MPRMDGIAATARLRGPGTAAARPRVVMLTTFDLDVYVYEALRAGASGFLLKDASEEELVARGLSNAEVADRLVVAGQTVKTHVSRVLAKLGLRDRVQLVVLAYETSLVVPGGDTPPG